MVTNSISEAELQIKDKFKHKPNNESEKHLKVLEMLSTEG
jgi:hypothetical protein